MTDDLEPTPRPLSGAGRGLVICSPEALVHVVTELLALCEQPKETIDLLVQYQTGSATGAGEGFVIVLDLDEQHLVLQGDQAFELGADLSLNFFLPGPGPDSPREKVSLSCRIESSRDEVDLIYTAAISAIDAHATGETAVPAPSGRGLKKRRSLFGPVAQVRPFLPSAPIETAPANGTPGENIRRRPNRHGSPHH